MEFVYVVPRAVLFPQCAPYGFQTFQASSEAVAAPSRSREDFIALIREQGFYVEREIAERTPAWKQIIPYVVVVRAGTAEDPEVFLLRRTTGGAEKRLHDKLSIGVGGHINPIDSEPMRPDPAFSAREAGQRPDPIPAACQRELREELLLDEEVVPHSIGILNDDTNPVGAVHLGLVEFVHVSGKLRVRETDQLEGQFTRLSHLEAMLEKGAPFETWSALLLLRLSSLLEASGILSEPIPARSISPQPASDASR